MNLLSFLLFQYIRYQPHPCTDQILLSEIIEESPIQLPEDYLNFLHIISGNEKNGISFLVDQDVDSSDNTNSFDNPAIYKS